MGGVGRNALVQAQNERSLRSQREFKEINSPTAVRPPLVLSLSLVQYNKKAIREQESDRQCHYNLKSTIQKAYPIPRELTPEEFEREACRGDGS
ncbi:MAG: hypothetical protein F6J93_01910 [Oscillatoria sp. SIO1A7]|nr:hypothetical protein [Oscillatoria sp. SIO1A7]